MKAKMLRWLVCLPALAGCRQDMWNGSRLKPLQASPVFADGSSSRPLVADTVARGHLQVDPAFDTGVVAGEPVKELPLPLTMTLLNRGQRQFNIYCAPCHDRTGSSNGMVVQRGFPQPPSYHIARLRNAPIGHFYDVMTNGYGLMYSYSDRVSPQDRWAIAAYIRALQRSRNATLADVPPKAQGQLTGQK